MVTLDGGLERLIHILRTSPRRIPNQARNSNIYNDLQMNWKWSLAFQCVVNIGVRGSEAIRTRVVESGIAPIIVRILESFLLAADAQKYEKVVMSHDDQLGSHRALYPDDAQQHPRESLEIASQTYTNTDSLQRSTQMEVESVASMSQDHETESDSVQAEGSSTSSCHTSSQSHAHLSVIASESTEDTEMTTEEDSNEEYAKQDALSTTPRPPARTMDVSHTTESSFTSPPPSSQADMLDAGRTPRAQSTRMHTGAASVGNTVTSNPSVTNITDTSTPTRPHTPLLVPSQLYREEEVLMSLQLLAYLSKYPHVRLFFHNADVRDDMLFCPDWPEECMPNRSWEPSDPVKHNVFSVAERFTLRSSRSNGSISTLTAFFPRLGHEIQYWAGVVMRNACRKDESRGGIRQCANMLCGWQMGHRFWCSARDDAEGREWKKKESSTAASHPDPSQQTTQPPAPEPQTNYAPMADGHTMHMPTPAMTETSEFPTSADTQRANRQPSFPPHRSQHYSNPLGRHHVPTTFTRQDSFSVPQMRGVSAASVETMDPDMSESAPETAPTSGTSSPSIAPRVGAPFPVSSLPPPIIAGSLHVHEGDPTTTTVREHEVQDVQEHGALEAIAAAWPAPGHSPGPSPQQHASTADFDLGIRMPTSPTHLHSNNSHHFNPRSRHESSDERNDNYAYGARRVSALTSWNVARQLSLQNHHRSVRAVSSGLLHNNNASDSEVVNMDDGVSDEATFSTPDLRWGEVNNARME
ncbi:hypothetical protein MYAM1_001097 [Malassezia yamatoensis]|uniref:Uncharacterized protein n=1 Tax=Malassezia yamatoensis TaxID=253288 RepID=A0AAJ5YQQ2_9BASI|nr:hypothetical protein MYAM1_001097 [Malassezia yamatoensis]